MDPSIPNNVSESLLNEAIPFLKELGFEVELSPKDANDFYVLTFHKPEEPESNVIIRGTAQQVLDEMGTRLAQSIVMPGQMRELQRQLREQLRSQTEALKNDFKEKR